ncbi:hypothetical protein PIROE2DRAFT_57466 [Piromyces sp. E2]|nr:hypothetical protein PIROE2DRAFT_57466 [Piromyces sp. E2]|eukprot:OUM69423.1 hypothetical protein PIROE2DRAFT_57466 [Piromyces sp. E2]
MDEDMVAVEVVADEFEIAVEEVVDGIDVVELFIDDVVGTEDFARFSATVFAALVIKLAESVLNKNGNNFGFNADERGKGGIAPNGGIVVNGAIGLGTIFAVVVLLTEDGADVVIEVCLGGIIGVDIEGINGLIGVVFVVVFGVKEAVAVVLVVVLVLILVLEVVVLIVVVLVVAVVVVVVLLDEVDDDFGNADAFGVAIIGIEVDDIDVEANDFDLLVTVFG